MTSNKAKTQIERMKEVCAMPSVMEQFKNALAENSSLFVASLIDVYGADSDLLKCEPGLVVKEALKAATLKLPINKSLGFAWIIARNKNKKMANAWTKESIPAFQIGWKGIVQLALRTGQYRYINCDSVLEGELLSYRKLTGELNLNGEAISDKVIGFFAYIELLNGFEKAMYWPKEKVEAHAIKYSQESKKAGKLMGNWAEHFESRAKSTVLKHLISKYGVMSVEMTTAFDLDQSDDKPADMKIMEEITDNANKTPLPVTGTIVDEDQEIDPETGEVIPPEVGRDQEPDPGF